MSLAAPSRSPRARLSDSPRPPSAAAEEQLRAANYPISRWYLRPLAGALAIWLTPTHVRPMHLTVAGLAAGCLAALVIGMSPSGSLLAGGLVLLAWLCDRVDGQLARRQGTASRFGAWLDANVDELLDVVWHTAIAMGLASMTFSSWPWVALAAFLGGKYLFMYSLNAEEWQSHADRAADAAQRDPAAPVIRPLRIWRRIRSVSFFGRDWGPAWSRCRQGYHLLANADVRLHLLAFALILGLGGVELVLFAAYYNVRWIARYALVAHRLTADVREAA